MICYATYGIVKIGKWKEVVYVFALHVSCKWFYINRRHEEESTKNVFDLRNFRLLRKKHKNAVQLVHWRKGV